MKLRSTAKTTQNSTIVLHGRHEFTKQRTSFLILMRVRVR
jgi:hypothetical protein